VKDIILCGHTGSFNHGCEAIIKGTAELFVKEGIKPVLATKARGKDELFGLDEFSDVIDYEILNDKPVKKFVGRIINKLTSPPLGTEYFHGRKVWRRLKGNIAMNVGGDTYCYDLPRSSLALNWFTSKNKIPNILWACSIERDVISGLIEKDLKRYTLIMPRESLTYDNLIDAGMEKSKLVPCVDPAFALSTQMIELDDAFFKNGVVGINLSPLVISECPDPNLVMANYERMIDEIIQNTDYNICFIPHVYEADTQSQDLIPLNELEKKYKKTGRTLLINRDYNCRELKYIISRCDVMVCARTHASIAAYSSLVPTLVVGYSVKSLGIAKDLFGQFEGYVLPTQTLATKDDLLKAFSGIDRNKKTIRQHLTDIMPAYTQKAFDAAHIVAGFAKKQ